VPSTNNAFLGAVVERERRAARRAAQALLQSGADHVEVPGVALQVHAAESRRRIYVEQRIVLAAGLAERGERLRHGG
jgi:hypothetical protein